jgi:hypothetical protein
MEDNAAKDIVYSKSVLEFLTVANEYCLFTEKTENYSKEDIISYMLKICPLLYLKGALLPLSQGSDFEITERYVSEEHWDAIYKSIHSKLGKDDAYWTIQGGDTGETVPVKASIADNLTDVYQDLKDFVMLYSKGTHAGKENAVAECQKLFESHWGSRIVSAHKALHHIQFPDHSEESFENDN